LPLSLSFSLSLIPFSGLITSSTQAWVTRGILYYKSHFNSDL
jgi:hypothetical protein